MNEDVTLEIGLWSFVVCKNLSIVHGVRVRDRAALGLHCRDGNDSKPQCMLPVCYLRDLGWHTVVRKHVLQLVDGDAQLRVLRDPIHAE